MIPYYPAPVFDVFGIPLDSWSLLVAIAFIVGLEFGRSRAISLGLDIRDIVDGALFIVAMGFVFGHWVHVLAYNPHQIEEQGWIVLLKIWAGFSSNGGFLGAIIGTILWFNWIRPRQFWLHADTIAFGLPFGWFFGRLGCFTAHDHVGIQSNSPLAVNFSDQFYWLFYRYRADCDMYERASDKAACFDCYFHPELMGPRFDLGLNEAILVFFICIAFFALRKKNVHHSFFAALFCILYAPVRFSMDFLRHTDLAGADLRWFGLTPAQYGSIFLFTSGIVLFARMRQKPRYEYTWDKKTEAPSATNQDVSISEFSETSEPNSDGPNAVSD